MMMKSNNGGCLVGCILAGVAMACFLPPLAGAAGTPRQPADPGRHHAGGGGGWSGLSPLSAPAPTTGADDDVPRAPVNSPRSPEQQTTLPHFGFPLEPTVGLAVPPPAAGAPSAGAEGYPFIGSNPTVPLPTGVTDTATVLPVPDRAGDGGGQVAGRSPAVRAHVAMAGLLLLLVFSVVS